MVLPSFVIYHLYLVIPCNISVAINGLVCVAVPTTDIISLSCFSYLSCFTIFNYLVVLLGFLCSILAVLGCSCYFCGFGTIIAYLPCLCYISYFHAIFDISLSLDYVCAAWAILLFAVFVDFFCKTLACVLGHLLVWTRKWQYF